MEQWHVLLQLVALAVFAYYYLMRRFNYWSSRGVPGPQPRTPFGNMFDFLWHGQAKLEREWPKKYGKLYGIYQGGRPSLTVVDNELVKQVLVKDFALLVNREVPRFDHEIFGTNLFNAEEEKWRRIRAITSPSFTTGKLRGMNAMMNQCIDKLAQYFDKVIRTQGGEVNMKEVITGFTIDVIATTSFGTETNANDDRSKSNAFRENGIKIFEMNAFNILRFFLLFTLPKKFNTMIGNSIGFSERRFNFFVDLARAIIKQRRSDPNASKRQDLMQLMMDAFVYEEELRDKNYDRFTATDGNEDEQAENDKPKLESAPRAGSIRKTLTENEIIGQCFIFFVAGFETTATTISNALYQLAINVDIQSRLRNEVNSALEGLEPDSDHYFEVVCNQITYLDAMIKETLRMFPPATRVQRRVGKDGYKLGGVQLDKDIVVEVSTYGVHYDPDYYPQPDRFDPDRFMPENKHKIKPYTYLPFGAGPRNCVGMRFAYQEIKLCLAKLISQYRFSTTPKTPAALKYNNFGLLSCANIPLKIDKI